MRQMLFCSAAIAIFAATFAACGGKSDAKGPARGGPARGGSHAGEQGGAAAPVVVKLAENAEAYLAHLATLAKTAEQAGEATVTGRYGDVVLSLIHI